MAVITLEDVARVDPSGMYATVLSSPEAFRSHLRPAPFSLPPFPRMLFTGMGGSAIAGDVLAGVLEEAGAPAEIVVRRSRDLPSWVDTDTLVLLSSYSGNTKDVNMLARQALSRGLQMVAVTSGGELSRWAEENSIPSLLLPSGIPPRAAFPQALATLFSLISSAHDLPLLEQWCVEAAEDLSALASSLGVETEDNPSLALATSLNGAIPVFYGAGHLLPTARRAAAQFNENAKSLAFHGAVPEMEHNEVVGWDQRREGVVPVLIRRKKGEEGSPRDLEAKHMDIIAKELEGSGGCLELLAEGRNPLSEVLSVVFKVDMASVYSAVLKGVDPTPVEAIQRIKSAFSS